MGFCSSRTVASSPRKVPMPGWDGENHYDEKHSDKLRSTMELIAMRLEKRSKCCTASGDPLRWRYFYTGRVVATPTGEIRRTATLSNRHPCRGEKGVCSS